MCYSRQRGLRRPPVARRARNRELGSPQLTSPTLQDLTAELSLGWTGWDAEILVSTDLGMTWVCDDYVFNLARPQPSARAHVSR